VLAFQGSHLNHHFAKELSMRSSMRSSCRSSSGIVCSLQGHLPAQVSFLVSHQHRQNACTRHDACHACLITMLSGLGAQALMSMMVRHGLVRRSTSPSVASISAPCTKRMSCAPTSCPKRASRNMLASLLLMCPSLAMPHSLPLPLESQYSQRTSSIISSTCSRSIPRSAGGASIPC
jgi:hypothetical protein